MVVAEVWRQRCGDGAAFESGLSLRNTDLFSIVMVPVVIRFGGEMDVKVASTGGRLSKLLRDKNHQRLVLIEDELTKEKQTLILKLNQLLRREARLKLRQKFSQHGDLASGWRGNLHQCRDNAFRIAARDDGTRHLCFTQMLAKFLQCGLQAVLSTLLVGYRTLMT